MSIDTSRNSGKKILATPAYVRLRKPSNMLSFFPAASNHPGYPTITNSSVQPPERFCKLGDPEMLPYTCLKPHDEAGKQEIASPEPRRKCVRRCKDTLIPTDWNPLVPPMQGKL